MKLKIFAIVLTVLGTAAVPGGVSAQPGSQPYVFYGEEPWGGSYLGVDTRDVTADRLSQLHLNEERGVEVTMVDQDAPAGKSGLNEHDVILSINDQKVESVEQLRRMIREIPAGRTIAIGISRGGQPITLKAQLAQRSKMPNMDQSFNFTVPPINVPAIHIPPINMPQIEIPSIDVIYSPRSSGMMIENLTPQLGDYFGVKSGKGVLVRTVERGSRSEQAGLRAGDVIIRINGSAVNDCSDFTRLLRSRTESKVSVTVMRDRKEQNLTLTLPEPRRSGSINKKECEDLDEEACSEAAAVVPEMVTAEIRRIQPEIDQAKKQLQEQILNHREELKNEMEQMQQELREHQEELQEEMKQWVGDAEI